MKKVFALIVLFMFSALLVGCGGGGGAPPATPVIQGELPAQQSAPSLDSCPDFQERLSSGVCSYNTAEYQLNPALRQMNALYAYEKGYHGEGVTVLVSDTGVLATHEDLSVNIFTASIANFGTSRFLRDPSSDWHGTRVAGVLVAARNGIKTHGVAPSATIVPSRAAFNYTYTDYMKVNGIEIGNLSSNLVLMTPGIPFDFTASVVLTNTAFIHSAQLWADSIADSKIVFTFSAGNSYLNGGTSGTTIPRVQVGATGFYPLAHPAIEDNMLIVMALKNDRTAAIFTNGCGEAMWWCVAAYGEAQISPRGPDNDSYDDIFRGTSVAAPNVAGALALLKSAAPELPMTVIRAILLTTATDIGAPGIDELYGWGLVNISAGIVSIEAMTTADGKMLLSDLRGQLPSEFAHLHGRLNNVSVALKIIDNAYHNIALSDIVGGDGDLPQATMGGAAKELLTDGFNAGESFRFWGGLDYADSGSRFIGESGGLFGAAESSDTAGYLRWTTADYDGFSLFGEYEYTDINVDYGGNSLVSAIDNARADGWTAGLQFGDLWRFGDKVRLSARQESHISGGEMILHYPVATGDFHSAFIGETQQTIRTQETRIPLKQKASTIWTAGYSQEYKGGKWAAAMEYNAANNKSGFSVMMEFELR